MKQPKNNAFVIQSIEQHVQSLDNQALLSLLSFYSREVKTVSEELRWRTDNGLLKASKKSL